LGGATNHRLADLHVPFSFRENSNPYILPALNIAHRCENTNYKQ
jgi:hypothetical protein